MCEFQNVFHSVTISTAVFIKTDLQKCQWKASFMINLINLYI